MKLKKDGTPRKKYTWTEEGRARSVESKSSPNISEETREKRRALFNDEDMRQKLIDGRHEALDIMIFERMTFLHKKFNENPEITTAELYEAFILEFGITNYHVFYNYAKTRCKLPLAKGKNGTVKKIREKYNGKKEVESEV